MNAHRDVLRREFDRIAALTDGAYRAMYEAHRDGEPAKLLEKQYADWASLLLRYHQAVEGVSKDEGEPHDLPSMKARSL